MLNHDGHGINCGSTERAATPALEPAGPGRIAEQQIQRYESTGYTSASLARLCDVVAALGVNVREVVSLPSTDAA